MLGEARGRSPPRLRRAASCSDQRSHASSHSLCALVTGAHVRAGTHASDAPERLVTRAQPELRIEAAGPRRNASPERSFCARVPNRRAPRRRQRVELNTASPHQSKHTLPQLNGVNGTQVRVQLKSHHHIAPGGVHPG